MKFLNVSAIVLASALVLASCSQKPKGDEAQVTDAQEAAAATGVEYAVNSGSTIQWIGSKPAGQHNGTIAVKEGSFTVNGENITGANLVFDLTNIVAEDLKEDSTKHAKLVGHLQSPDFFDVANHPEGKFELTSVAPFQAVEGEEVVLEGATHTVTGNLTLRGTTLAVTFPAIVHVMGDKVHAEAKFNIDRTKWGVSYGDEANAVDKAKDFYINNTVNVAFNLMATKAAATTEETAAM
ncbi:YceI family protein [Cytophagales bacterium LB-30]|uniref:YceI family protein n=1 Tax=Shiella aurantiaca TaxID=3058365 RepID=A0ABT8F1G4_9BACT|nr:YceI family protein [Shiella aurantiaca]MDN4164133.1 YceI family protein [Shiella aurantiaca]